MTKPITLIFDLDGTLVETAPDLCAAMNATLKYEGRSSLSLDEVRLMVGQGAKALIRKGMAGTGEPASEEDVERLFPIFMDYYSNHICQSSHPYPYVMETLDQLRGDGYLLTICTNKPEAPAKLLLDALGMSHFFLSLIGGDTLPSRKPEATPLIEAVTRAGGDMSKAVMIGDSITDVHAARNAGIPMIGVSFGYTETPMRELGADLVIDHFGDLPQRIKNLQP